MLENNNENSNVKYIFIVFIWKLRENSNRIYDQEILKVFLSKENANLFAMNYVEEKLNNDCNQSELSCIDDNLFCFLCMDEHFYNKNGFYLKIWVEKSIIINFTTAFNN